MSCGTEVCEKVTHLFDQSLVFHFSRLAVRTTTGRSQSADVCCCFFSSSRFSAFFLEMNRRNPSRIELKLDDLSEFDYVKKELEDSKAAKDVSVATEQVPATTATSGTATRLTRATGMQQQDRLASTHS